MSIYAPTLINSNSGAAAIPAASNNFSLYDNSTYGIKFQSPNGWNKVEVLAGRITFVEFTSPSTNVTGSIEPPAQVVVSMEKGLGNVTNLQEYTEAGDKLLGTFLGNFTITSQPSFISGEPAISRIISAKHPVSGIDILIAQVFTLKDDNAYAITYTAPASIYYNYVPIVEQVVNSFQITK
jgi:serine/threonine-protein kinase